MNTGNLKFTRNIYVLDFVSEDDKKREYSIKQKPKDKCDLNTDKIKIELDKNYHNPCRSFNNWIYFRNDTNYKRCHSSGLGFTKKKNVFEGNIARIIDLENNIYNVKELYNPQHFILVQFSSDMTVLIVDLFKDFYPYKKGLIQKIVNEHVFVYEDTQINFKLR